MSDGYLLVVQPSHGSGLGLQVQRFSNLL